MKLVASKFVLLLLSQGQKEFHVEVAEDLLQTTNNDPHFLKQVITGDGSWVYSYDHETKAQSFQWKSPASPRPKRAHQSQSNIKAMLTVFFDHEGLLHHKYAPPGQTIMKEYYVKVLHQLRDVIRRKQLQLWASGELQIHHYNMHANSLLLVQVFLAKHHITRVSQPHYTPDLAPCVF